jgi:hypothetical protein
MSIFLLEKIWPGTESENLGLSLVLGVFWKKWCAERGDLLVRT